MVFEILVQDPVGVGELSQFSTEPLLPKRLITADPPVQIVLFSEFKLPVEVELTLIATGDVACEVQDPTFTIAR